MALILLKILCSCSTGIGNCFTHVPVSALRPSNQKVRKRKYHLLKIIGHNHLLFAFAVANSVSNETLPEGRNNTYKRTTWSIAYAPHSSLCHCAFTAQPETYKIACHFSNCRMFKYFVVHVEKAQVQDIVLYYMITVPDVSANHES